MILNKAQLLLFDPLEKVAIPAFWQEQYRLSLRDRIRIAKIFFSCRIECYIEMGCEAEVIIIFMFTSCY